MLSADRIGRLTSIGFTWDVLDARWDEMYETLGRFRAAEGHCGVPTAFHNQQLAHWVGNQRTDYQRGRLWRTGSSASPNWASYGSRRTWRGSKCVRGLRRSEHVGGTAEFRDTGMTIRPLPNG